jgi:hypothetical protein
MDLRHGYKGSITTAKRKVPLRKRSMAGTGGFTPVILDTQEAEIKKITVRSQT